ncbi:MAG TPA: extracellular solute-binding protein [Elusimicrobiota bacterium]|nr:extracellular solute-binding protein [Elusimicrobiota bacterium]
MATAEPLRLWHAYRGKEEEALQKAVALYQRSRGERVELLAVPYDAFAAKLIAAIPHGNGPDVFIFSHPRIASFHDLGLLAETEGLARPAGYIPTAVEALRVGGRLYGYPLSIKCLALYANAAFVREAPKTTRELVDFLQWFGRPAENRYGLAYESGDFYYHAPVLLGFGGKLFDASGRAAFDTPEMAASLGFVRGLQDKGLIPQEATGGLVKSLFNSGRAAMVVSGPWFAGEVAEGIDYKVYPLPVVSETGKRMSPLLEVEAALVSSRAKHPRAQDLARFLSEGEASRTRAEVGRQIPADLASYRSAKIAADPYVASFRAAAEFATPLPSSVEMSRIWEPMKLALRAVLQGDTPPRAGGAVADRRYRALYRSKPSPASPWPYAVALLAAAAWALRLAWRGLSGGSSFRKRYPQALRAFAYMSPAAAGVLVLVLIPFAYGMGLALFHHEAGHYVFVGLSNFKDILFSREYRVTEPLSFYFTLAVTVLWTVVNVSLHVGIGLALALMLKSPLLRMKGAFRILLILPWAVPNYITALMWKGMFHRQFGALNGILVALGLHPISWFSRFSTAFAANVITNTWLGFPFMMVVCLGALQSIPQDLYEAAEVDGASAWTRFRRITLPLLRPALAPSIVLGIVWTFNMFNIIFLVSGGDPGGSTDILVSEAFRWAFQRNEQYGFAAAYSVLIFLILLAYSSATGASEPSPAPAPRGEVPAALPARETSGAAA